jgi:hypothetical protein
MKLATLTADQRVSCKGYYTTGDTADLEYLVEPIPSVADGRVDHTLANGTVARLQYSDALNVKWAGYNTDIGETINAATAAGHIELFIPAGIYTQSTALTSNQELYISGPVVSEYGFNQVTITKDFDSPHIETTAGFASYGITWDGSGTSGTSAGLVMHGKFEFIGSVTGQPGDGLQITETSASHNNNGSIIAGAFASNGGSGILIENTVVSDSTNIDQNAMSFPYIRANSNGVDGVTFKGGLFNKFPNVRCDNNGRYGIHFEATNAISTNLMSGYAENNGVADWRFWENATNNITDNHIQAYRGSISDTIDGSGSDLYQQGNRATLGRQEKAVMTNSKQPWVHALQSTDALNATGAGTTHSVNFDTEIKDTQGNMSGTTYTAPITGRYRFSGNLYISNLGAGTFDRARLNLVTTNRTYYISDCNPDAIKTGSNTITIPFDVTADMDSNETGVLQITISGGTDVVTINGASPNAQTWMTVVFEG